MPMFALRRIAVSLLALALLASSAQASERRTALVIGNGAYASAPLKNPVNDARDIASALRSLGFDVTLLTDATHKQMESAARDFGLKLRQGGAGLFYFAGHGLQVAGENYLVPVDAVIASESDVRFGCLNAGLVLGKMEDARNGLNMVILDACRNNPFARSFRSAEQGLAKMDAPTGSIIAYATAPGSVAADGAGRNGVYTSHLLRNMRTPGLSVTDLFMRVRMGVVAETGKRQVPWEASSLTGYFYLSGEGQAGQAALAEPQAPVMAKPAPALPSVDIKAEKKRMAEEAERLKREKQQFEQLKSLKAEKDRLDAERQKLEEAKLYALGARPQQPPPAQAAAPSKSASKPHVAANAPYFSMLARHGVSDAQRYFESAVQARPEDADARAGLAVALLLTKREGDAKYHVRRVEESGQTTPGTRVARGFMLGMEGQLADSSYQLNRALEEGADRALVQLALATAAAKKNEMDQAKKAMDAYRTLVSPVEENEYAKEMARKVDLVGRLVGSFYWTMTNKAINAYTSTITFTLNDTVLSGVAGGFNPGTIADIKLQGKVLTFRYNISGLFGGSYDFTCDLSSDLDTIPVTTRENTFGQTWQGYLIRQGSMAQNLAYHANPADCFIATAAYGEPFEEHVATLRRFRDGVLAEHQWGRDFVAAYYALSPPLAEAIRQRPWARAAVRGALAPVVLVAGAANGDARSAVWLGLCLGLPAAGALAMGMRRRARTPGDRNAAP